MTRKVKNKKGFLIYFYLIIFYVFNHVNALESNKLTIYQSLRIFFCGKEKELVFKEVDYCKKIKDISANLYKDDFDKYFDYFKADGDNRFAKESKIDVVFSKKDGKIVNSDSYFKSDAESFEISTFFFDDVVIFYFCVVIDDLANFIQENPYKVEREKKEIPEKNVPIIIRLDVLIMDKEENNKIYTSTLAAIPDPTYEQLKKDFDRHINFLREELPIKVEY